MLASARPINLWVAVRIDSIFVSSNSSAPLRANSSQMNTTVSVLGIANGIGGPSFMFILTIGLFRCGSRSRWIHVMLAASRTAWQ